MKDKFTNQTIMGSPIDLIMSKVDFSHPDMIYFSLGMPSDENLPKTFLQKHSNDIFLRTNSDALNYGGAKGDASLIDFLLQYGNRFSMDVRSENVLITAGSTQGFDLCARVLLNQGDVVLVESPTYSNSYSSAISYGAKVDTVQSNSDGICINSLKEKIEKHKALNQSIKFLYLVPNSQNPTGATISLEKRMKLLELARLNDFLIIEDDPYQLIHFDSEILPSIFSLDKEKKNVIYLNSFSKTVSPGYRVGWVFAHKEIILKLIRAKQVADSCSNVFGQAVISSFCTQEDFFSHVDKINNDYFQRRQLMNSLLEKHLGNIASAEWDLPNGGFFIWLKFGKSINTIELLNISLRQGVVFVPGNAFDYSSESSNCLRLCFSQCPLNRMEEGIIRLKISIEEYLENNL